MTYDYFLLLLINNLAFNLWSLWILPNIMKYQHLFYDIKKHIYWLYNNVKNIYM